jgi:type VI secretion system secreted protein VgrG
MTEIAATRNSEHVSLSVAGTPFEVVTLRGGQRLSRLFSFQVMCRTHAEGLEASEFLGKEAEITLRDSFGAHLTMTGIVAEAATETYDDTSAVVTFTITPEVFPLTLGRTSRAFQQCTVVDIAEQVLAGKRFRLALTKSYPLRVYTVQYREDDWTFLSRLLEEEGIYVWFDHEGGTTLVLSDNSTAAPHLVGGALVPFKYESGMRAETELIEELASEVSVVPTRFTVASFDPQRPALPVTASIGQGPLEIYQAPGGGPTTPAICAARAQTMAEAAAAAGSGVAGLATSVRLVPGMIFEVIDHPLPSLDGRYLVTEVDFEANQRIRNAGSADVRPYACRFRAIRRGAAYRPPTETPAAKQAGLQTGIVVGPPGAEIHTHHTGEVRVQQHWDREGERDHTSGKWMRVAQRGTASSMLLPRIGWTVLTFNEEGTVDAPNVLSRIHDGEHLPPYGLPARKTRVTFKTATTPGGGSHNEIYFEDLLGAEEMFIHASKDHNVLVQHVKREAVMNDSSRKVGVDHALTIGKDKNEGVKVDHTVLISGREEAMVHGERNKTISGNESISIGGSREIHALSSALQVGQTRNLAVGAALMDLTLGTQSAASQGTFTMTVGGAAVKVSGKAISEQVGKVTVQTIGGAKLEYARKDRVLDVRTNHIETVGGNMILKTNGTFMDHADTTTSFQIGAAMKATAPEIYIEARTKIVLRVGASSITISGDSVEIKASSLDLSKSGNLHSITQTIVHN